VLKVGSSLLAGFSDNTHDGLDARHAAGLARFIAQCHAQQREVVLVSSGAVAADGPGSPPAAMAWCGGRRWPHSDRPR
jgi:glutamate 5-kinase